MIHDGFPDIEESHQQKDDALHENRCQRPAPGISHADADRIGEERVQPHAGGQREGQIGIETHHQRRDRGGDGCSRENPVEIHSAGAQNPWIDHQDIGHGHKGDHSRGDFCPDICPVFRKSEFPFQKCFHNKGPLLSIRPYSYITANPVFLFLPFPGSVWLCSARASPQTVRQSPRE